MQSEDS